jgi:nucleoside-diphosphate-sugar epimerase
MNIETVYRDKNILITGGLGFIGSSLAVKLADFGAHVTLVDSLIPGYGGNPYNAEKIINKVKINISDIRDISVVNSLVPGKDYLFNMAGTLSHIDSMDDPHADLDINCRAQLSLLEACKKNNRGVKIIFAGTRSQYGKAGYLPVDENHPMKPLDVNGVNNTAGEAYHLLYNDIYGIRAVSLRLTNVYGPRHQMKHPNQGFLNWFIRLALDNEVIKIYGDGKQLRDFNYIDDVVEAVLLAGANDRVNGEVFNLGGGSPVSVVDAAKKIIGIAGRGRYEFVPFPEDKKKIEIGDYCADYSKISAILGWKPTIGFDEGLKRTIDFYNKNKIHYWTPRSSR